MPRLICSEASVLPQEPANSFLGRETQCSVLSFLELLANTLGSKFKASCYGLSFYSEFLFSFICGDTANDAQSLLLYSW